MLKNKLNSTIGPMNSIKKCSETHEQQMDTWHKIELQLDLDSLIFTLNSSLDTKIKNQMRHMAQT